MRLAVTVASALCVVAASGAALPPASSDAVERQDGFNAPRLVNYVQTFHDANNNPLSLLPLLHEDTGITHVNLAALHINEVPGDINLNDNNPNASYWNEVWSDVKQLQAGGIKVLMMLGGAEPGSYHRLCGSDVPAKINESYYEPLRSTIAYHGLDGMDLDIEESVDVSCAVALLERLDADFGSDFILTMAPVASAMRPGGLGLSGFNYVALDSMANDTGRPNGKLVSWYNAQFYNGWGSASSPASYNSIIDMGRWSADRVVMGVLDSPNDGGSGFVNISTLTSVILQLRSNYQDFGCAVGWEYWDAGVADGFSQPWEWVKAVGHAVFEDADLPPANYSYASVQDPPSPWQAKTNVLVNDGTQYMRAIWALNLTRGNLEEAQEMLGFG